MTPRHSLRIAAARLRAEAVSKPERVRDALLDKADRLDAQRRRIAAARA